VFHLVDLMGHIFLDLTTVKSGRITFLKRGDGITAGTFELVLEGNHCSEELVITEGRFDF
jgi:hypothetical protein